MKNKIVTSFIFHADLLLPYLVLASCLFIPSEIIITRFKVDETSAELNQYLFQTVLYGYQSTPVLFVLSLTVLSQLFTFLKSWFCEFGLVFMGVIYLALAALVIYLHPESLDLGFYFSLMASGFILFLNLKRRFW